MASGAIVKAAGIVFETHWVFYARPEEVMIGTREAGVPAGLE